MATSLGSGLLIDLGQDERLRMVLPIPEKDDGLCTRLSTVGKLRSSIFVSMRQRGAIHA